MHPCRERKEYDSMHSSRVHRELVLDEDEVVVVVVEVVVAGALEAVAAAGGGPSASIAR